MTSYLALPSSLLGFWWCPNHCVNVRHSRLGFLHTKVSDEVFGFQRRWIQVFTKMYPLFFKWKNNYLSFVFGWIEGNVISPIIHLFYTVTHFNWTLGDIARYNCVSPAMIVTIRVPNNLTQVKSYTRRTKLSKNWPLRDAICHDHSIRLSTPKCHQITPLLQVGSEPFYDCCI